MLAITLWQPWATLIAIGAKTIETRSWGTSYRGPLAIHAAKRPMAPHERAPFEDLLQGCDLPLGHVLAICKLADVWPIRCPWPGLEVVERRLGDFSIGRYAWFLGAVELVDPPVPARGRQGLWNWDPDET